MMAGRAREEHRTVIGRSEAYMKTAKMTKTAPIANKLERGDPRKYMETREVRRMDVDVANPLRMLSANLMTSATRIPPKAWRTMTTQT